MRKKRKKKKDKGITAMLDKSPINYFSDLFVVTMVVMWIVVLVIMIGVAIYATKTFCDTTIWSEVANLVAVPLSCGGAIWMIKNSVQHAIAYKRGERAHMDFPAVNAEGQDDGIEREIEIDNRNVEIDNQTIEESEDAVG